MQFICPQDGLPSILPANAPDETSGAGAAEIRLLAEKTLNGGLAELTTITREGCRPRC
jgi:hypothetical protein